MKRPIGSFICALALFFLSSWSRADGDEHLVGAAVERNGLRISAAYVLGVAMHPAVGKMGHRKTIHLEADIAATAANRHGFKKGDWVPYLSITYLVRKEGSDWFTSGVFYPMTAKDGPHYAAHVRLKGPGKYRVVYRIAPPIVNGFRRHTDKATGVPPWWTTFKIAWRFTYPGPMLKPRD